MIPIAKNVRHGRERWLRIVEAFGMSSMAKVFSRGTLIMVTGEDG